MVKKSDKQQVLDAFSLVGSIGLNMVATVVVGLFGGRQLDHWLGTTPWATVLGIVMGMVTGLWATYKRVTDAERDD